MRLKMVALLLFLAVPAAFAQKVTIGSLQFQSGGTVPGGGIEMIDTSHPAIADGSITNAAVRWLSDNACSGAFKLRVFRLANDGINVSLVGETPALDVVAGNGVLQVAFPAIAIKKGDLLGVVQVLPNCGGVTFSRSTSGDTVYPLPASFTGGILSGSQAYRRMRLDAVASNGSQHFAGVIPVAGAVQGSGAFFRTSLQLANGSGVAIDGKLVWHAQGAPGTPSDPSLAFHLAANATVAYDDIATTMGQSGIGTLDVYASTYTPEVTARVFNDAGSAGTYGLAEDLVPPSAMFDVDQQFATIPIAADLANYHVNLGVRTLDAATTIGVSLYDAAGHLLNLSSNPPLKTYPANYFEQVSLSQFLGNFTSVAVPAGGTIQVYVTSGGPIVYYTSTIDNRTKDSDVKMITAK